MRRRVVEGLALVAWIVVTMLLSGAAAAEIVRVEAGSGSLQSTLDRAQPGDVIELGPGSFAGPIRIESMFPLGQSGQLWFDGTSMPIFDPNYLTMIPPYDSFMPRSFPLFD